jgi:uncharacterized Zn finger protein
MMKQKHYSILLDQEDYKVLKKNSMIMICCQSFLKKVKQESDLVELLLTKYELNELKGFVAAEANHATSKQQEKKLEQIFIHLDSSASSLS